MHVVAHVEKVMGLEESVAFMFGLGLPSIKVRPRSVGGVRTQDQEIRIRSGQEPLLAAVTKRSSQFQFQTVQLQLLWSRPPSVVASFSNERREGERN